MVQILSTSTGSPRMETRNAPSYEEDFVAWLQDQAGRARRGEVEGLDLENIAEELEGLARSDRREIRSRLTVLLTHLLKCLVQPRKRSSSWLETIAEQRDGITQLIEDSPSLRAYPGEFLERSYPAARRKAARQTRLPEREFPERCPFDIEAVLDPRWIPGRKMK
jgi:hypothetical protein